jgi:hypothetical protein
LGSVVAPILAAFITFSSVLCVVFVPLLVIRLLVVRTRTTVAVAVAYFSGLQFQLTGILLGAHNPTTVRHHRYEPLWVLGEYARTAVPRSLLGERWVSPFVDPQPLLIELAWLIVGIILVVAFRKVTAPAWRLAVLATFHSVIALGVAIAPMGCVEPRYVIAPSLLIYAAIWALLRPGRPPREVQARGLGTLGGPSERRRRSHVPAIAFAVGLSIVFAVNYRMENGRSSSPSWRSILREATTVCQRPKAREYTFVHSWWTLRIPCARVR